MVKYICLDCYEIFVVSRIRNILGKVIKIRCPKCGSKWVVKLKSSDKEKCGEAIDSKLLTAYKNHPPFK